MKIEPRTLKGFRDFLPNDARKRVYVINILKSVFESYGFEPLETPSLEYAEILTGKYGDEGDKLMYRFKDNGDRDVALRYDQTVPLARVVAQYKDKLPLPFKRYQVQNVWRAENTQKGRFREFLQCDIDTVGSKSMYADAEIIACAVKCLDKLGFKGFKVLINDREVFKDIPKEAITIIDKLKKIGEDGVKKELSDNMLDPQILDKIMMWDTPPSNLKLLIDFLNDMGVFNIEFSPTLARGLDYYTGTIFEIEIENYSAGSICGGGRYDGLIGMFEGNDPIPAFGCAFGFDRLIEAMEQLDLFPNNLITTKALVVVDDPSKGQEAVKLVNEIRNKGINSEVYIDPSTDRGKQFKYADKKNIPYTITIEKDNSLSLGFKNKNGEIEKTTNLSLNSLLELLDK